ncbi:MAG: ABC-F family ATP-binding cassette domain-containing protein [Marinifilaceae bacterium]|jgi:ATP-binding cassette subfamily F protein uup|nr:ABC-F family ATP-binding cassette domain-containing protein [Marinifilaceae bacterium]
MICYLQVENLSKRYGSQILFENISFSISKGQKVAIIAPNGTGKTSLLNIIAEKDSAETGSVIFNNEVKIGYLEQTPKLNSNNTVIDEIFSTETEELNTIKEYNKLVDSEYSKELEDVIIKMDNLKAWDIETRIKQILTIFKINNLNQKISELSGGQKKRIGLAKILLTEPNFLILDEPTNHLDIEMIEWLEDYLDKTKSTLLMVTHDRYFLDRICNSIIEMDNNQIYNHNGNYSYYLDKREERILSQRSEISKAKNLLRTETEWMRRMPKARGSKAKYREDSYHKLKKVAEQNIESKELELDFIGKRLGKKILNIENLNKSFDDLVILKDFTYKFSRGEKIGIIGKNGVGKTTFLDLLTGRQNADSGSIEKGETISYGYYRQENYNIDESKNIIEVVSDIAENFELENGKTISAAKYLELFLFDRKKIYTSVNTLSGGEKKRLYLLTILVKNPNFLILDEPTNDLDILTLNVLENFLLSYKGCVIVVSHDRYFMDKIVNNLFVFEGNGKIKVFPSNYSEYFLYKKETEKKNKKKPKELKPKEKNKNKKKLTYKERIKLKEIEKELEDLYSEKEQIENKLNSGNLNSQEIIDNSTRIAEIINLIDEKEFYWLELNE